MFQAVRDLEDRLGIQQGEVGPEEGDDISKDPLQDEWVPTPEAAKRKGVTLPGLHKAINRGDVIARPATEGGRRLVISVNSLSKWEPNATRQAARKNKVLA